MERQIIDTICALSTPPGIGAIAVVRLSGPRAIDIANRCFRGKCLLEQASSHTIHYGQFLRSNGDVADYVTASVFRAPHSYTGEDVVEISCHGGYTMYRIVLETLLNQGARLAEPGEFTRRAFLNGKMDLVQVESIAEVIHSQVIAAQEVAAKQLGGTFSSWVRQLREKLEQIAALVELELDFAQEDLEFADRNELAQHLKATIEECQRLIRSYTGAQILRHGLRVGIVGFPNAGKSSLFNAILGRHRALVSPQPGTTRDYVEDTIPIGQTLLRLYDTAGFRDTADAIEVEGIALARSVLEQCHIILIVNDITKGIEKSDALASALKDEYAGIQIIMVQNKCDMLTTVPDARFFDEIMVSARTHFGIDQLVDRLAAIISESTVGLTMVLVNQRHVESLQKVSQALTSAYDALEQSLPGECIALDLRSAAEELCYLLGERWTNDLLDRIFTQFCIGK